MESPDKTFDRLPVPFADGFNAPVGQISDEAAYPFAPGGVRDERAKTDPLYAAAHQKTTCNAHGWKLPATNYRRDYNLRREVRLLC